MGPVAANIAGYLVKKAEGPALDARADALRHVLTMLGLTAAAGVGSRALVGARHLFGTPTAARVPSTALQVPVRVPVLQDEEEEEEEDEFTQQAGLRSKIAQQPEWISRLAGKIPWGAGQTDPMNVPWYLGALTLAATGGGLTGWKAMDWLMDRKRRSDIDAELEASRKDYEKALLEELQPKRAGTVPDEAALLNQELDQLAAQLEGQIKQASITNKALNVYGALATILGLGSTMAAYQWSKARGQTKLLEEAIKQRARERLSRRPPELVGVETPVPIRLTRQGEVIPRDPEDEEE